jgi:FkbM family methyltransferase
VLAASAYCNEHIVMSRTIAAALVRLVRVAVSPFSRRQQCRISAGVIDGIQKRNIAAIDTRWGELKMLRLRSAHCANAAERFFTDEPETLDWIDGFDNGDVLMDVGANIGTYSLYGALNPNITMIAIEPNGINFGVSTEHIATNDLGPRVYPFCIALGAGPAITQLHMSQTEAGAGGSSIGDAYAELRQQQPVFSQAMLTYSIDKLVTEFSLPAPRHIKIDVDGTDQDTIAGPTTTLKNVHSVLVEIEHRGKREVESTTAVPLRKTSLVEDVRGRAGSERNRIYVRAA